MILPPEAIQEGVYLLTKMFPATLGSPVPNETVYYEMHSRWCEKYDREFTGMSTTCDWCKDKFHIGKNGVQAIQARIDRLLFLLKENGYDVQSSERADYDDQSGS